MALSGHDSDALVIQLPSSSRYHMYMNHQEFKCGDGIVNNGVEATIQNVGRLGREGMRQTDKEIVKIMLESDKKQEE